MLQERIAKLEEDLDGARDEIQVARADRGAAELRASDLRNELEKAKRNQEKLLLAVRDERASKAQAEAGLGSVVSRLEDQLSHTQAQLVNTQLLLEQKDKHLIDARAAFNVRVADLEDQLATAQARMRAAQALSDPSQYVPRSKYDAVKAKLASLRSRMRSSPSPSRREPYQPALDMGRETLLSHQVVRPFQQVSPSKTSRGRGKGRGGGSGGGGGGGGAYPVQHSGPFKVSMPSGFEMENDRAVYALP